LVTRKAQPYECCVCGKDRSSDANHWWLAWESLETVLAQPWNDEFKDAEGIEHVCGLSCLSVQLGRLAEAILKRRLLARLNLGMDVRRAYPKGENEA
jgi:hypothetical protein